MSLNQWLDKEKARQTISDTGNVSINSLNKEVKILGEIYRRCIEFNLLQIFLAR